MKILGRSPRRIAAAFWQLPAHVVASFRCFLLFRRPSEVLWSYIKRQNPPGTKVELRDGLVINLSMDNSDIVTVFLIFCRHDYGRTASRSAVVDIGANIGVFALYAAREGAKIVHAYEPVEESFGLLQKNIENNGLGKIIFPHKFAVVGQSSSPVRSPRRSSVFNALDTSSENDSDQELVPTIAFTTIVSNIPESSMFKLDCDGGGDTILFLTWKIPYLIG